MHFTVFSADTDLYAPKEVAPVVWTVQAIP